MKWSWQFWLLFSCNGELSDFLRFWWWWWWWFWIDLNFKSFNFSTTWYACDTNFSLDKLRLVLNLFLFFSEWVDKNNFVKLSRDRVLEREPRSIEVFLEAFLSLLFTKFSLLNSRSEVDPRLLLEDEIRLFEPKLHLLWFVISRFSGSLLVGLRLRLECWLRDFVFSFSSQYPFSPPKGKNFVIFCFCFFFWIYLFILVIDLE